MDLRQSNIQTLVISYTRTELLPLGTNAPLLSLSTFDHLNDFIAGCSLPLRHRPCSGAKRKKQNMRPFFIPSFNTQSVRGNDMAGKHCEISTYIRDNGIDLFFVSEVCLNAHGDEVRTVSLPPGGFDIKYFLHQS